MMAYSSGLAQLFRQGLLNPLSLSKNHSAMISEFSWKRNFPPSSLDPFAAGVMGPVFCIPAKANVRWVSARNRNFLVESSLALAVCIMVGKLGWGMKAVCKELEFNCHLRSVHSSLRCDTLLT